MPEDNTRSVGGEDVAALRTGASVAHEGPGAKIGPYKLLQLIGEGGFGSVFMAEQEKPVLRRVALKIIKLGMDTRQVIARFEAERQALAMMDHPNIAKVLDAGATDAGRPYFVMELVKGEPITAYCDKGRLAIRERLDLFVQVCRAVQHAHQKGLIHRDLKPSNILVGSQDARPIAKVIDFGIAKATSARLTEKTLFTEHHALVGTPEYMSPEQAEGSLDIDTRTDVYALGVVLYELLTGSTPFDPRKLRSAAYAEIQRIIREDQPPRPSTRLSQSGESLATVAACRHTNPGRLGTILRGDLDWIVMKALEKDRARRYETANGLALDVERYLTGQAVLAAPPSATYRLRTFVRRNRVPVIAAGLVVAALVLGVIGTGVGLVRARAERRTVLQQRDVAAQALDRIAREIQKSVDASGAPGARQIAAAATGAEPRSVENLADATLQLLENLNASRAAEARQRRAVEAQRDKAELVAEFMSATLRGAGPRVAVGRDTTVLKEILEGAARRIEAGELKHAPEAELTLRLTIGHTYRELAEFGPAQSILRPVVERARALAEEDPDSDRTLLASCLSGWGSYLKDIGRVAESEPLYDESLAICRRFMRADSRGMAQAIMNLASVRQALGRLSDAESLSREALDVYRRALHADHVEAAGSMHNLAFILQEQGNFSEAEPLYREALDMYDRLSAGDLPDRATTINNLGMVCQATGRLDEAESLFRDSLAMRERVFKGDHLFVSQSLNNMSAFLFAAGRTAEALPFQRRSLEMNRRLFTGDHPAVANSLSNLGVALVETGRATEAEPLLLEALEMEHRLFPGDHPETASVATALANAIYFIGRFQEAEALYREALEMRQRLFPTDNPDVALSLSNLAGAQQQLGRTAEAAGTFEQAASMAERLWPEGHPVRAAALARWAACLLAAGRAEEARPIAEQSAAMAAVVLPEGHPVRARIEGLVATIRSQAAHPAP